jgi:hypothetical protein
VVISGTPPDISPLKTTSPKKGTIEVGPKEHELTYQIKKRELLKGNKKYNPNNKKFIQK